MKKLIIVIMLILTVCIGGNLPITAFAEIGPNGFKGATVGGSEQVSCTTTEAVVIAGTAKLKSWVISNHSGSTVYIGVTGVTSANGFILPTGYSLSDSSLHTMYGTLYCRTAAGTAVVSTLKSNFN